MNFSKLKQAELLFLEKYPGGFAHPDMASVIKKHKPEQMHALAQTLFAKEAFENPEDICFGMTKLVSRSSVISVFEKPKFRDSVNAASVAEREGLASGLYEMVYGDQEKGFGLMGLILHDWGLAKWSLMTVCLFCIRPQQEVFMKPTTVKDTIRFFDILGLDYHPRPTYDFYRRYRHVFLDMKAAVDPCIALDNGFFSGFLMMASSGFPSD